MFFFFSFLGKPKDDRNYDDDYDVYTNPNLPPGEFGEFTEVSITCEPVEQGMLSNVIISVSEKKEKIPWGYHNIARLLHDNHGEDPKVMDCISAKPPKGQKLIQCICTESGTTKYPHCFLNDTYKDLPDDLVVTLKEMFDKRKRCVANMCALGWRCELAMGYIPLSIAVNGKEIYRKN